MKIGQEDALRVGYAIVIFWSPGAGAARAHREAASAASRNREVIMVGQYTPRPLTGRRARGPRGLACAGPPGFEQHLFQGRAEIQEFIQVGGLADIARDAGLLVWPGGQRRQG